MENGTIKAPDPSQRVPALELLPHSSTLQVSHLLRRPVRDGEYYDQNPLLTDAVILQCENTLFRVSRIHLAVGSHFFTASFGIPGIKSEGRLDSNPIHIPGTTAVQFSTYLKLIDPRSYIAHPSEEDLFLGFELAIRWSVPRLVSYLQCCLLVKIRSGTIHPMVVIALARKFGLPWLIQEATESLARGDQPLAGWCSEGTVLKWILTAELGVIAAMKERLWTCREKMADVPKAHHCGRCLVDEQAKNLCESAWDAHWFFKIQKYIIGRHRSGSDFRRIKGIIQEASILGMNGDCRDRTVVAIVESGIWAMEADIIAEAAKLLMVNTAVIDGPDGVQDIERVYEVEPSA